MASAMTASSLTCPWTGTWQRRPGLSMHPCSSPVSVQVCRTRSSCRWWRFLVGTWTFALDIRAGDGFRGGLRGALQERRKLKDGNILVAVFTNQGRSTRIVRYDYPDGRSAYVSAGGCEHTQSVSALTCQLHPHHLTLLTESQAPQAASIPGPPWRGLRRRRGTPIKAAGDARVEFIGYKGGYGKTIVLRHAPCTPRSTLICRDSPGSCAAVNA